MKKLLEKIKQELFADEFVCLCCGDERFNSDFGYLCKNCYDKITFITHPCQKCGDETGGLDAFCENCKSKDVSHKFDKAYAVAKYAGTAKELVYSLKYGKNRYVAKIIIDFLLRKFDEIGEPFDVIIPVPLGQKRLKKRGFNQAEVLARGIASERNIILDVSSVIRAKETRTQTDMTKHARAENVKNAFAVTDSDSIKDKKILLLDDIVTTGATTDEISRLLLKKGAKSVSVLAFCHA